MTKKNIAKRKLHRECYSLDYSFLKWLQERLPIYLKDANKIVDLNYHKFEYRGETYTQKQLIERLINNVERSIKNDEYSQDYHNAIEEVLDIWKLIFSTMWW